MSNEQLEKVVKAEFAAAMSENGPFGLWINSLWPSHLAEPLSFKKATFLTLLQRLIEDGHVVLFVPNGVPRQVRSQAGFDAIWAVPPAEMIRFIEDHWPTQVTDDNDPELNTFWYDPARCPGLGWVDPETGEIVAS